MRGVSSILTGTGLDMRNMAKYGYDFVYVD